MSSSSVNVNMNPYWNYVATPFLFVVVLFGMFVLFNLEPGYFRSMASVQAAAAAVALPPPKPRSNSNNGGIAALTAVAGQGKPT